MALLGGLVALGLVLLARVDFGNPEGSTRARLAREAEAAANLAQAAWERRLEDAAVLGASGAWRTTTEALPAALDYGQDAAESGAATIETAPLLAAEDQRERGDGGAAKETLDRLLAKNPVGALGAGILCRARFFGLE
ncbi:MAG: hypothetical protein ACI8QC_004548 [Planctomycetota bacterium]